MSEYVALNTTVFDWQKKALEDISNKTGIPQAYMVRQAINMYLESRGEKVKRED